VKERRKRKLDTTREKKGNKITEDPFDSCLFLVLGA
jgi:hypothetical protein